MKLWQFLKRWRQAYLDDKGDRLHAQVQAEKEMMEYYRSNPEACSTHAEQDALIRSDDGIDDPFKQEVKEWMAAAAKAMEDERNREYYY